MLEISINLHVTRLLYKVIRTTQRYILHSTEHKPQALNIYFKRNLL